MLCDFDQPFRIGTLAQLLEMLGSDHQAEVEARHDVGPAVREHQVDLGCPTADALGLAEHGDRGLVVERIEGGKVDAPLDDVAGEAAAVTHLGPRQADGAQLLVREQQEFRRLHAGHGLLEAQPDRARGVDRDLLADDRAHQAAEAGRHLAKLRMSDLLDGACEIRIDLRQMPHRLPEIGGVENRLSHAAGIARGAGEL
jgi:hypothetical protein